MPHIIVTADRPGERPDPTVVLSERVNAANLRSRHYAEHLMQRLGWAVEDAQQIERTPPRPHAAVQAAAAQPPARVVTTAS